MAWDSRTKMCFMPLFHCVQNGGFNTDNWSIQLLSEKVVSEELHFVFIFF